jgi:diadenosine tetraphosphate (Ap4A) HIT family hydrolase
MHVHFHIIPRFEDQGLEIGWNAKSLPGETADRLRDAMRDSLASG